VWLSLSTTHHAVKGSHTDLQRNFIKSRREVLAVTKISKKIKVGSWHSYGALQAGSPITRAHDNKKVPVKSHYTDANVNKRNLYPRLPHTRFRKVAIKLAAWSPVAKKHSLVKRFCTKLWFFTIRRKKHGIPFLLVPYICNELIQIYTVQCTAKAFILNCTTQPHTITFCQNNVVWLCILETYILSFHFIMCINKNPRSPQQCSASGWFLFGSGLIQFYSNLSQH
jgi:hypothetical protein